jgi:hypothetical protein
LAADEALPRYSSKFSRHDFTQAQLFTLLVLKAFFRTDYRGISEIVADCCELQRVMHLKKVPHASTLCYAERRLLKKRILTYSSEPYLESHGDLAFYEARSGQL